jgi:hypothetical protein
VEIHLLNEHHNSYNLDNNFQYAFIKLDSIELENISCKSDRIGFSCCTLESENKPNKYDLYEIWVVNQYVMKGAVSTHGFS